MEDAPPHRGGSERAPVALREYPEGDEREVGLPGAALIRTDTREQVDIGGGMTRAGVDPINDVVDRLRSESRLWVPKVSRKHGGIEAPILSVLQDPGKATEQSGVLCTDNLDRTSRRQRELMVATGLNKRDLCPWNAYPWQHDATSDGALTPEKVARGAVVLREVIGLMTDLRVLLLQGEAARWAWGMVQAFAPELADKQFDVVATLHPLGPRGNRDKEVAQLAAWQRAAQMARDSEPRPAL